MALIHDQDGSQLARRGLMKNFEVISRSEVAKCIELADARRDGTLGIASTSRRQAAVDGRWSDYPRPCSAERRVSYGR